MKAVFLDIDGVLNSVQYDRERNEDDGNIDKSRLALIKKLVDATSAKIVLSSTWREHWEKNDAECDLIGKEINKCFAEFGLKIYDKTPFFVSYDRPGEIKAWLNKHRNEIERFVIIDDAFGGWGELNAMLVQTDARIGRGLEERHIQKAIEILK